MQDALGRVRGFVIVFLNQGTPNIVWSNCKRVLLFSINNGSTVSAKSKILFSEKMWSGSAIYITFEDGNEESSVWGHLGPHVGYRWIRLGSWTAKNIGSGTGSNRFLNRFSGSRTFCSITAEPGHL